MANYRDEIIKTRKKYKKDTSNKANEKAMVKGLEKLVKENRR